MVFEVLNLGKMTEAFDNAWPICNNLESADVEIRIDTFYIHI